MKICKDCKKLKRLSSFYIAYKRKGKMIYSPYCKKCNMKRSIKWRSANPEKKRLIDIKYLYGMAKETYFKMLKSQKNKCKVCSRAKKLVVDHCHKTGKIRGLLCSKCNQGLGHFEDNSKILIRAVEYLKCH